jgi:acyl carrier protein
MTVNELRDIVLESLVESKLLTEAERDRLRGEPASDLDLASLKIDSLKIVDWCMALEGRVKREVQIEELVENDTLNRLAKHLAATTA